MRQSSRILEVHRMAQELKSIEGPGNGWAKIEGSVQILPNSGTLPCLVGT
jgi:hypothetical protein